jgi:septal ring factor EnvC (AmiA/AmiB activator)
MKTYFLFVSSWLPKLLGFGFALFIYSNVTFLFADPVSTVHSEAVSVKKDLHAKKRDLKTVQRRLANEKKKRQAVEKLERNVLSRLDSSDRQLEKLNREKRANEGDLGTTLQRIKLLEGLEFQAGQELQERRLSLGRRLRAIQRARSSDPIFSAALGLHRSGDFSRRLRFGVLLARSNQKLLEQVEEERRRLVETTDRLNGEKVRRVRILDALDQQKRHATNELVSRKRLLVSIRNEKAVREAAIQDLDSAAHNLSSKVGELLRQQVETERREDDARRAEEAKRQAEAKARAVSVAAAQVGRRATPEPAVVVPAKGRLASPMVGGSGLRRGLLWPVSGTVTQRFGKTKSREFNTTMESAGLQIRAAHGAPVKAVASGRVRYADWFQGYGKLVILDHGRGYYSLYAQASDLFVAPGDTVSAGQVIASVGDTGSLVGDSLYFEVRKDGLPQNPLFFLRPKG